MYKNELSPRPERSLSLYKPDRNFRHSGYVYREDRGKQGNIWDVYAAGYLDAVQELIQAVKEGKFRGDNFGYPIFYLFSHYLELRFKEIVLHGRPLIGEDTGFSKGHDLIQLWGECKRILKEVDGWKEYSELDDKARQDYLTMDHFIRQLSCDPRGQSFRYPVDRDGNPLLADDSITALNIENLSIVVNWLSENLDGISIGIDEERIIHDEIRAEFSEDYCT